MRVVVKVGGSLLASPGLADRLSAWLAILAAEKKPGFEVLLVPGGGAAADAIRDLDRTHNLGEERAHWLALRAVTLNAHVLAELLPAARAIASLAEAEICWQNGRLPILDGYAFARADEANDGRLPHSWAVTSDSLAARVARVLAADQLVLLKSTALPAGIGWEEAARLGLVDDYFPQAAAGLVVDFVNFAAGVPLTS